MTGPMFFFGGHVVTCDDSAPNADAVLIADGQIAAVGAERDLRRRAGDSGGESCAICLSVGEALRVFGRIVTQRRARR